MIKKDADKTNRELQLELSGLYEAIDRNKCDQNHYGPWGTMGMHAAVDGGRLQARKRELEKLLDKRQGVRP